MFQVGSIFAAGGEERGGVAIQPTEVGLPSSQIQFPGRALISSIHEG